MISSFMEKVNSRIAHKLAMWVIIFSSIITLMATIVQFYLDYRQDIASIEDYFTSIKAMQLQSISQSVWIMDDRQIESQLEGIIKGRDITFAAITIDGHPRWQTGENNANKTKKLSYHLIYSHKGVKEDIGTLEIVASLDRVHRRLLQRAGVTLLANGFKTFLFAGLILLLFQYSVTRHLEKLASHVVRMNFQKKRSPLKLDRDATRVEDEFSQVVNILNMMQRRGYHAFRALEKSELRLRLFFDSTEEGIFGIDLEERFTFVNTACLKMIDINNRHDIIGRKVEDILVYSGSGNTRGDSLEIFKRSMETGQSVVIDDGCLVANGGSSFYASVRSYPIIAESKCTGAIVFFNDISEQREILREKNLLRQAVRQSPIVMIISDEKGNIEYVNPGFEKITGFSLKDVIGKKPYFLGSYMANRDAYQAMRQTLRGSGEWQGRYHLIAKDGTECIFDTLISPVFSGDGGIINLIAVCLDITQKIELQRQLNHAQKMEAVGRLSSSFAHEFGNPLMGVRSVIKDISERIPMGKDDKQLLGLAYAECERMKVLVRDFQQFQRSGPVEKKLHDVHLILDNVLFFYKKKLENNDVVLDKKYAKNLPKLFLRKDQMAQVFLNLIINGVDSMVDEGGTLTVSTHANRDSVLIKISDSGGGIDEKFKEMIFEPFFTTKPEVEGTGLGLSVSYGIVSGHGGEITVSSELNNGSTFTIMLPIEPLEN